MLDDILIAYDCLTLITASAAGRGKYTDLQLVSLKLFVLRLDSLRSTLPILMQSCLSSLFVFFHKTFEKIGELLWKPQVAVYFC